MRTPIAEAIAQLVSERNVLAVRLDLIAAAIETLQKLQGDAPAPAPRARLAVARPSGPESVATRLKTGRCEREGCGKLFAQPKQGRARHYCSVSCGKKARKGGVAVRPAPSHEPQRMPRADRPVDNAELDSLLARSKRGAA